MSAEYNESAEITRQKALEEALKKVEANFSNKGKGRKLRPQPVPSDIGSWGTVVAENLEDFSLEKTAQKIAYFSVATLVKKHQDYGPDNINNAPGGAMNGLLVRMHDKMERLKTLIMNNKEPKYESIEDTLVDMINYSIIALMVQRGEWPK